MLMNLKLVENIKVNEMSDERRYSFVASMLYSAIRDMNLWILRYDGNIQ